MYYSICINFYKIKTNLQCHQGNQLLSWDVGVGIIGRMNFKKPQGCVLDCWHVHYLDCANGLRGR